MAVATSRDDEIRLIWTENQWLYLVAGFLGGILFCLLLQLSINNLPELVINLLPEAAGIFITVTVIDVLNRRRDERNTIKQLHEQLVRDASSMVNDVANNAVHQMKKRGWLKWWNDEEGLLVAAKLELANLQGANLELANLQRADLVGANLQEAHLVFANLSDTRLARAKLQKANLTGANLQGANLRGAKLQGSILENVKLQKTDLMGANLEGVNFGHHEGEDSAQFDTTTRLPDGTFWTPETDMTRFTNPKADSE